MVRPRTRLTLIDRLGASPTGWSDAEAASLLQVRAALEDLATRGLSPDQVQWLFQVPFSRFGKDECVLVIVMQLRITQHHMAVASIHALLRE